MTTHHSHKNDVPKGLNLQYIQDGQILPFHAFLGSLSNSDNTLDTRCICHFTHNRGQS